MTTPIQELQKQGQSLWLDNIRRQLITSGELAKLREEGVTGVTSNPTIFDKAVSGSTDYDEALVRLVGEGKKPQDILWDLMLEDIRAAADVFRPVYDRTEGADGYVSIEVSPELAMDTTGTVAMARDLFRRAERPNVMVKIPGTEPGLPAIRQMLGEGVNINVTLIFSTERYDAVVDAFMAGLEDLRQRGGDVHRVASVASFFVSRVDSKVDRLLDGKVAAAADPAEKRRLQDLMGRAGIANSKVAYEHWKDLHSSARWRTLADAGARPQRCLWASTSTKDPRYSDTMYVEELIGPDTVDTVPPATLAAFREHGEVRRSLDENLEQAHRRLSELAANGVDLNVVTHELEVEGVESFSKSFESLTHTLENAARDIKEGRGPRMWYQLGTLQPHVDDTVKGLQAAAAPKRVWSKDASFWPGATEDPARWLGWLNVPEKMLEQADRLSERAQEARVYSDVVVLGMGGSSLCPDVFRTIFEPVSGRPRLHVLDTTDPATIQDIRSLIDVGRTLFLVSSKSGGTTETMSHLAYFWEQVTATDIKKREEHFAAITDLGTSLEELAAARDFRWIFLNPSDIGGRYSALSYFGLVPGALMGVDVRELLERAQEMASACEASVPVEKNPGFWLGAAIGGLAARGRNKLTLVMSPAVATFGYWLEQLLAESTGKEGRGIVPVEGEPVGPPEAYGSDRLFVYTRMADDPENPAMTALEKAGQPVITLTLRDKLDLGGEMLRWELATAVAGALLGIDPFNQPNVQESKDNTKRVLAEFESGGRLPEIEAVPAAEAGPQLARLLGQAREGGYLASMAYTARTEASEAALARIRTRVRKATRLATTAGYGPRFLHSTGQLHKGGPPTGLFLQIVQDDEHDLPIPGQPYSFSVLKQAQALGDHQSLASRGYPVLRVTLGRSSAAGWEALTRSVEEALR
ncbi:MAG: bifunctional transaldolase/phosoglucose isomerase [Candidatus Dormibacteraeota bacterium]|nr:bifunctional transaldolase/phosoglucose isomerase [Candidatus Dormibacteraeota bacterium]